MNLRGKIRLGLLAVTLIIITGTVGYRLIGGWDWFDCLYMTLITLTTIGYAEMPGMTEDTRYFTVALIIVGITTVGYTVSVVTQYIIQTEISSIFGRRKVIKTVGKLRDHFIICGAGRMGSSVAREMRANGARFVIIEREPIVAEKMLTEDYLVVTGDATDEAILKTAGIEYAEGIVCAASSDAENVYTTLMARDLNPRIRIVTRASEESAESKLFKAGADKVVSPTRIGSFQMARAALKPYVSEYIELTTMPAAQALGLESVLISEGASFAGKSLVESGIRSKLDVIVVAIRTENGEMLYNPAGDAVIHAGDRLIAVGRRDNLLELEKMAS
jgi:voltage-gated potassium channel